MLVEDDMNNFKVSVRAYDVKEDPEAHDIRRIENIGLDMGSLEVHYRRQGEACFSSFRKFSVLWESPHLREVVEPEGSIVFISPGALSGKLEGSETTAAGKAFRKSLETSTRIALMAWTIGSGIEEKISRYCAGKERVVGFLLDAAASLLLNEMHKIMRVLVREEAWSRFSLSPMAEHYPGVGRSGSSLIGHVLEISRSACRSGIEVDNQKMIHPEKSQCSAVLLGEEKNAVILANSPCIPCPGKRCPYFQLGGCHVDNPGREA